ncbi:hypothetical protein AOLI_G00023400 [Acnodon oligacanthus]
MHLKQDHLIFRPYRILAGIYNFKIAEPEEELNKLLQNKDPKGRPLLVIKKATSKPAHGFIRRCAVYRSKKVLERYLISSWDPLHRSAPRRCDSLGVCTVTFLTCDLAAPASSTTNLHCAGGRLALCLCLCFTETSCCAAVGTRAV